MSPAASTTRKNGRKPAKRRAASPNGGALTPMVAAIDKHLARTLKAHANPDGALGKAIAYAALSPGKRLRPLLALTACEAAGGKWKDALPAAAALECVHAFSLVHDDLPAMDDDDMRRGRPTTHKRFGEAIGVLTGDALLAFAFEELTRLAVAKKQPARALLAVRLLAEASGATQLVQGQALDIAAEGKKTSRDQVAEIHLRKTGALIAASLAIGAIAGGANAATVGALHDLGLDLGLAFQIHDDLLNAYSTLARLGKRAGTDAARGKATWPRAVGEDQAINDAGQLYASVDARIAELGPRARKLRELVQAMAAREQ